MTSNEPPKITPEDIAIRAHDVTVCMQRQDFPDFESLTQLGLAVRLALHLRGVPAISYETLRSVAVYLLDFPTAAVRSVLDLLATAEFVRLDTEGQTIRSVIPTVPYFETIFGSIAEALPGHGFSEPENLTVQLLHRLARAPLLADHAYQMGAERSLVDRIVAIGGEAGFLMKARARGRDLIVSPTYFPENPKAYADLVAGYGSSRLGRTLDLLRSNQGWPLQLIRDTGAIGSNTLDQRELALVQLLAGEGFVSPPAIRTTHAGEQFFLFGPRPGITRLPPFKRPIYEAAMALVAAVRQGQLLPRAYRIHNPLRLLQALRDRGFVRANTEAIEQYRQLVLLKVGRLEPVGGGWARFHLIDRPENREALDFAIAMVTTGEPALASSDEVLLALRSGEEYIESLVGRKLLAQRRAPSISREDREQLETALLRGAI